jgi:hypothetical protein
MGDGCSDASVTRSLWKKAKTSATSSPPQSCAGLLTTMTCRAQRPPHPPTRRRCVCAASLSLLFSPRCTRLPPCNPLAFTLGRALTAISARRKRGIARSRRCPRWSFWSHRPQRAQAEQPAWSIAGACVMTVAGWLHALAPAVVKRLDVG